MNLPCFLTKIAQAWQNVIIFFLERGKDIEPWFWHIWIARWLKFFRTPTFFDFDYLQGEGSKLDQKCKLWDLPFSIKTRTFQKIYKQWFCLLEYNLGKIGPYLGVRKGPTAPSPKRSSMSWMLNRYAVL